MTWKRAVRRSGSKRVTVFALTLLGCLTFAVAADQADPRLDDLFAQLQETRDIGVGESITQEIWTLWYDVDDERARDLLDEGDGFMAQADFPAALAALTELTRLRPEFAEGWNRRATLYYLMGEYSLSIRDIEHTLQLEPRHFGAISGLGQIFLRQNKPQRAREAFVKALEINPHLLGARMNIIQIDKILNENAI